MEGLSWADPIGYSEKPENALKVPNLELKEYLTALFKSGDIVNFVVSSFEKDGKFLPSGKGGIPRRELGQGLTQCREKVARIPTSLSSGIA